MSSDGIEGEGKQAKSMMGSVQAAGEQAVHKAKEVGHQVTGTAKTTMQEVTRPGFVTRAANTSGKIIGFGIGKAANVFSGFISGFETGMNAERQPKQGGQQQAQQPPEAPHMILTEEEKIEKKVTKEME